MVDTVNQIWPMLLIASIVAMLARRSRIPYTVGLVVVGIFLVLLQRAPDISLTKDLLFSVFLPPLIFEASFHIEWKELRANLSPVCLMATFGLLLSAIVSAAGMHFLAGWWWAPATVFGVLISATDPVSVIATFKNTGITGRVRLLVEAESLFNDGTAAVLFLGVLPLMTGGGISALNSVTQFFLMVVGGIAIGLAVGGIALLLAGPTDDHLVEITFTTVAAYGSFLTAEHFHLSGVLAATAAGLLLGNVGHLGSISDRGREAVESFWEYIAFVANSLIFLLLGVSGARVNLHEMLIPGLIAFVVVLIGRAATVYICSALLSRSDQRITFSHQHILVWGGLRGALALALAFSLTTLPWGDKIKGITIVVVTLSVVLQGLTITPLLKRMGEMTATIAPNDSRQAVGTSE